MSIVINRIWPRYRMTAMRAIALEYKKMTLKPVKKIVARYDPFHEKTESIRHFMVGVTGYKVKRTNPAVKFSHEVVCDRSTPQITISLSTGDKVQIETDNLNLIDLYRLYNQHITSTIPYEPDEYTVSTAYIRRKRH